MILFFNSYDSYQDFFNSDLTFNDNLLLSERKRYGSLETLREALESKRNGSLFRGSINGYIQKLSKISALDIYPNPKDRESFNYALEIDPFYKEAWNNKGVT